MSEQLKFYTVDELQNLKLPKNKRAQWIDVDDCKIYLDAYNANPTSMELAVREFSAQVPVDKRTLYLIGAMNELGEETEYHHAAISKSLNELSIKDAFLLPIELAKLE